MYGHALFAETLACTSVEGCHVLVESTRLLAQPSAGVEFMGPIPHVWVAIQHVGGEMQDDLRSHISLAHKVFDAAWTPHGYSWVEQLHLRLVEVRGRAICNLLLGPLVASGLGKGYQIAGSL